MKENVKIEFDRFEIGMVINALNQFKTDTEQKEMDTSAIVELLKKIVYKSEKKGRLFRDYGER